MDGTRKHDMVPLSLVPVFSGEPEGKVCSTGSREVGWVLQYTPAVASLQCASECHTVVLLV
jgi:hypothetical protein